MSSGKMYPYISQGTNACHRVSEILAIIDNKKEALINSKKVAVIKSKKTRCKSSLYQFINNVFY